MRLIQRELHEQLKSESIATRERIARMVRSLGAGQLAERPEAAGWSVGEVLEHLCVSDELYAEPLARRLATATADAGAPTREWRSSFFGGLLANLLEKPGKMKAPKAFQPGPTPRDGVLEAFLAQEHALVKMMDKSASLDWGAVRLVSPAVPAWMPKFNLGDVFRIHVVHVSRHGRQIDRLVKQLV